jgi:hypothetical protein
VMLAGGGVVPSPQRPAQREGQPEAGDQPAVYCAARLRRTVLTCASVLERTVL